MATGACFSSGWALTGSVAARSNGLARPVAARRSVQVHRQEGHAARQASIQCQPQDGGGARHARLPEWQHFASIRGGTHYAFPDTVRAGVNIGTADHLCASAWMGYG